MEHINLITLENFLLICAKANRLTNYEEVAKIVASHPHGLSHALGEVSRRTFDKHGVMLTAIVVSKTTGQPGNGFYELAEDLYNTQIKDKAEFWAKEVQKVLLKASEVDF